MDPAEVIGAGDQVHARSDVLEIHLTGLDQVVVDGLSVPARPRLPIGHRALVQPEGRDDRLRRAAVRKERQDHAADRRDCGRIAPRGPWVVSIEREWEFKFRRLPLGPTLFKLPRTSPRPNGVLPS